MSDDEDASHSEEEEEEEEDEEEQEKEQQRSEEDEEIVEKKEESEAEKALKKRRETQRQETTGLDETAKELLESNRHEREQMENEIQELRRRNERRKKEREIEEKRLTAERAAEDERRKAAEEAKRRMKSEEEEKRQKERAKKMAEFEKWKNPPKPNFVITKRSGSAEPGDDDDDDDEEEEKGHGGKGRKSKEQLEAEKRAILQQRIKPLETQGYDAAKLAEKAKELHSLIFRLEGEKYDLEKQFKAQQFDMMELAERARQANKVGKGGLKRIQPGPDDSVDRIQERFAGAPAKIEMYSKYERQKDKRSYDERLNLFTGPQFLYPAERIKASKLITWNEEGIPVYAGGEDGGHGPGDAAPAGAEE